MSDDDKNVVPNMTQVCLLQLTGQERVEIDQVWIPKVCLMKLFLLKSVMNRILCFLLQILLDAAKTGRLADVQVGS